MTIPSSSHNAGASNHSRPGGRISGHERVGSIESEIDSAEALGEFEKSNESGNRNNDKRDDSDSGGDITEHDTILGHHVLQPQNSEGEHESGGAGFSRDKGTNERNERQDEGDGSKRGAEPSDTNGKASGRPVEVVTGRVGRRGGFGWLLGASGAVSGDGVPIVLGCCQSAYPLVVVRSASVAGHTREQPQHENKATTQPQRASHWEFPREENFTRKE
jgi:hypothetical protein